MMAFIATELKDDFNETALFEQVAGLSGETYREVKNRRTFRFQLGRRYYFAKVHFGVGWSEIFKNLFQLRLPVLGASNEWRAIRKLQSLQVATMTPVAFSSEGINPAKIHSCLITESLEDTLSLEDLVLQGKLTVVLKRQLLVKVGRIARALHENGVNHRDFYICHFLLPNPAIITGAVDQLYLIDLHRAQIRSGRTPLRWQEKDLAALLFSSADAGLTRTDLFRFLKAYLGNDYRDALKQEQRFWARMIRRAVRLYQKDHGQSSLFLKRLEQPK